jgi:hypothetical protein
MLWNLVLLAFAVSGIAIVASGLHWDRYDWRSSVQTARRIAPFVLFVWLAYWGWQSIAGTFSDYPNHMDTIGVDGRLYYRAASTWLAGGDPWTAYTTTNTWPPGGSQVHFLFTGPPPTVLAFAPFAWIPETPFVIGWFGVSIAAAVYTLRRLQLPVWWILCPPMMQGLLVANPQVVCLALLLAGSDWLRALAAPMKAYAVIAMVGLRQWRALGILTVAGGASVVVFWPLWARYAADFRGTSSWLMDATNGGWSASREPLLWVTAAILLVALATMNWRDAGWLAVPALWPAAEFFYATFVLPLRSPWLIAALAMTNRAEFPRESEVLVGYIALRVAQGVIERLSRQPTARRLAERYFPRVAAAGIADPVAAE